MNPAERKLVRLGHTEASRLLAMTPRAGLVPDSHDVANALYELGFEVSRLAIVAWCRELRLALTDAGSDADITAKHAKL